MCIRDRIYIKWLFLFASCRHGERCLADAGGADQTWGEGKILLMNDQPAGKKLSDYVSLSDPLLRLIDSRAEGKTDAVDDYLLLGESRLGHKRIYLNCCGYLLYLIRFMGSGNITGPR